MNEQETRVALKDLDRLRKDAANCEDMHTYWADSDGELVVDSTVKVVRRWRGDKQVHSEIVMSTAQREIFRSWLRNRAGCLRQEVAALENAIFGDKLENEVN